MNSHEDSPKSLASNNMQNCSCPILNILEQLWGELSSRDVILGAITFALGWVVAYYYHRQLRHENRELKIKLDNFRTELVGNATANVRRSLERLETIPNDLLRNLGGKVQEPIEAYNEEIIFAENELEAELREAVGSEYWSDFRSAFLIAIDYRGGKRIVRDYLLGVGMYGAMLGPSGQWYDALSTALYHCKKFESVGKPVDPVSLMMLPPSHFTLVRSPGQTHVTAKDEHPVAHIKREGQDDLVVILGGQALEFADDVYRQLSQTLFGRLERIDGLTKQVEAALAPSTSPP